MKVHSFFNIPCTRCTGGPKGGPGERAKESDEGAVSSLLGPGGAEAGSYFESHHDSQHTSTKDIAGQSARLY